MAPQSEPRKRLDDSMEDVKALQLFKQILAKTQKGRLGWEPTARSNEYFCVLPGGFIVSITLSKETNGWGDVINEKTELTLSAEDQVLLRVTPEVDGVGADGMGELYELARRQALGVNAQVDKVLGEL